jgi:hypothetical protein
MTIFKNHVFNNQYDFLKNAINIGQELSNVVFVFMKVGVK